MSLLFIRKHKSSVCRDFVFPSSYAPQDLTLCFSRLIATHATCHPLFCYSDPCPATSVPSPTPLNFAVLILPRSNLQLNRASPAQFISDPRRCCALVCLRLRRDQGRRAHKASVQNERRLWRRYRFICMFSNPRLCAHLYYVVLCFILCIFYKQTNLINKQPGSKKQE